jgi:hypothetical protein
MVDLPNDAVPNDAFVADVHGPSGVYSITAKDAGGATIVSGGVRDLDRACARGGDNS